MFYCCQFIFALVSMKLLVNLQPYTKEAFQYWGGGGGGGGKAREAKVNICVGGGYCKIYIHACMYTQMYARVQTHEKGC